MSQTFYCPSCDVCWYPYMCADSKCPECWGGLKRVQEPGSLDADARFKAVMAKRADADAAERKRNAFEAYYAAREVRLNGLDRLPVAEPVRPVDVQHGEQDIAA